MPNKTIYVGSDHAGYEVKQQIVEFLKQNYDVEDVGTYSLESVDYPDYAFEVCEKVVKQNGIGILICGTGFGMCIAANKVKGIRAVDVYKPETASLGVEHNNANVLCLSARFNDIETNKQIVNIFLNAKFLGDRHNKRLEKIYEYENKK